MMLEGNTGSHMQASQRGRGTCSTSPYASPPPLIVLPGQKPRPARSDLSQPIRPKIVSKWIAMFKAYGRPDLADAFYAYAEEHLRELEIMPPSDPHEAVGTRESWGYLVHDRDDGTYHVPDLMCSLLIYKSVYLYPMHEGTVASSGYSSRIV